MARRKQETMVIFPDLFMGTKKLTDAQFGALMRAVFAFRFEGREAVFDDPMVDMAFDFIKPQLIRYQQVCETNRRNRAQREMECTEMQNAEYQTQNEITECNESQRSATECNEMQGKPTHNHTHNRNHTHNHTHNHTQNHNHNQNQNQPHTQNHKESVFAADKPPEVGWREEASMIRKEPSCLELEEFREQEGLIHVDSG